MLSSVLQNILKGFLEVLKVILGPLLAYFQGRKTENLKQVKEALEREKKDNEIEESNRVKSDRDIFDELRERDTRKS